MHGQSAERRRHKSELPVRMRVVGEPAFSGIVYVALNTRLVDLLNDDRAFIPVTREDGETIILAKSQIVSMAEITAETSPDGVIAAPPPELDHDADASQKDAADVAADIRETAGSKKFDPYALLRVRPEATVEEVRAAYKKRVKAVHPDTVASLGLEDSLATAALKATQRINFAYRKILQDRESARPAGASVDATA